MYTLLKNMTGLVLLLAFTSSSTAALVTFTIPDGLNTQGTVTIVSSGHLLSLGPLN